jgi:Tfp pilus assembly protein PilX
MDSKESLEAAAQAVRDAERTLAQAKEAKLAAAESAALEKWANEQGLTPDAAREEFARQRAQGKLNANGHPDVMRMSKAEYAAYKARKGL